jgi:hypothetical protein
MQQSIVIALPNENSESEALKCQFDHYLKLMEVFETRQTWVFNFAIILYIGAFATSGPLLEHIIKPAIEGFRQTGNVTPYLDILMLVSVGLYSLLLPALTVPLCYLYVDVSIFGAALSAGTLPTIEERFGSGYKDPGGLAFNWIDKMNLEKAWWHPLLRTGEWRCSF